MFCKQTFATLGKYLCEYLQKFGHYWQWREHYAVYESVIQIASHSSDEDEEIANVYSFEEADATSTDKHTNNNYESYRMEYHIVFDEIFQVPVLYFRCQNCSTQEYLYKPEQVLALFPMQQHDNLPIQMIVTQGEHPHLQTIFFYLHPCQTNDLIQQVSQEIVCSVEHENLLLFTWLSTYGACIGYAFPIGFKMV